MGLFAKLIKGAVAGAVAGFVLKKVDHLIRERQDGRSPSTSSKPAKITAPEIRAVEHINEVFSLGLEDGQKEVAAHVMKLALMTLVTTISRQIRSRTVGHGGPVLGGAVFGVLSYALINQMLHPLLGISPSPRETDVEDHMREVVAHAASGIADNATRQLIMA